ncbi:MAG: SLBB domain-containing protein [Bacteroidales bacterium]|nr:SLBB domain-containing protein [Bacteroidales bacterium]
MLMVAMPAMAMTDQQVVAYITAQTAAGKSQSQIGQELLAKGVTPEQIQRIKAQYEKGKGGTGSDTKSTASGNSRLRTSTDQSSSTTKGSKTRGKRKSKNSKSSMLGGFGEVMLLGDVLMLEEDEMMMEDDLLYGLEEEEEDEDKIKIYGHDIFDSRELSFEPNVNMATPQNYRLGPGDEVIIDIWGASEDNLREEISPDGKIVISQLGPVHLNGMTVAEANRYVKNIFAKKYAGVGTDTDINLTLGNIRSIQVDVMGEVKTPGSFRISPFSNVFHAIYNAEGINDIGSLRDIKVMRNGKVVANVDFYDYMFKGKDSGNIRLQEGDVVIVPPYSELVNVEGNAKRPMYYEMKPGESLSKLIEYAGGFAGNAYSDVVKVERLNGSEKMIYTIEKSQYPSYTLRDGDIVTIGEVTDKYSNKVELKGAVNRPGTYAISDNLTSVRQLIEKADGLAEDAYLQRALIYRERPDRSLEIISVNIGDLMNGLTADIKLNRNDVVEIANANTITERGALTIEGYVAVPGQYQYAAGTTVEDLVLQAGGLLEGASTARVEVARRIVDQNATDATTQIAEMFTFGIGDNADDRYKTFSLMPYDVVHIRKSPTYRKQEFVKLDGELLFPGSYALETRNERVSEIVKRSGGLLESAYVKGAYLKRKMSEEQKKKQMESIKNAQKEAQRDIKDTQLLALQQQQDSIQLAKFELEEFYNVGIDLEKALANPGSTYDFVLKDGDQLMVPELQSTVQISGDVLFPNTVTYVPGKKLKYYVEQAGGYSDQAKKSKAFVVYMNGSVAKAKGSTLIEPGCHIIVPTKDKAKFDWSPIFQITSTLGSLATLAATVVALTK